MALLADDAADRAEQILLLTERLAGIVEAETAALSAGKPARPDSPESVELQRLANAYRLEMARIKGEPALIADAPRPARERLQTATAALQVRLDGYAVALGAAREVTEGVMRAMAQEVQTTRRGAQGYGAQGSYAEAGATEAVALDRRA